MSARSRACSTTLLLFMKVWSVISMSKRFLPLILSALAVMAVAVVLVFVLDFNVASDEPEPSAPAQLIIDGERDKVYSGLNISSTNGDCIEIRESVNITIRDSNIGPCRGLGVSID